MNSSSEIKEKALALPDQAKAIRIVDPWSYTVAADFLKGVKSLRAEVAAAFDPIIKSAHDAHKTALAQKKAADTPLDDAERIVKGEMVRWDNEQERIRRAEEARLAEEARKLEEERRRKELAAMEAERERIREQQRQEEAERLKQAEALDAAGKVAEAEAAMQAAIEEERMAKEEVDRLAAEAERMKQEPVAVSLIQIPKKTTPKVEGVSYTEVWKFEIFSSALIPREYLIPDTAKIGSAVRSSKGETSIPGIRVFSERQVRSSR